MNKNLKLCNARLADNGNTSVMNIQLSTHNKAIKFIKRNQISDNADCPSSIKNALLNNTNYDTQSERYKILTVSVVDSVGRRL